MGFSKNYLEDKNFEEPKNLNIKQSLIPKKNSDTLNNVIKNTFTFLAENIEKISKDNKNIKAAEIFSDININNEKFLIAEGNVLVIYKNMILSADKLKFNREKRLLKIQGNINFKSNDQFLEASKIEYNLKNKKGFIKDAYGSINFETLNNIAAKNDLKMNINIFENLDKSIRNVKLKNSSTIGIGGFSVGNEEKSSLIENLPQKIDTDINEMSNWRFLSKRIEIQDDLWTAEKLFLTNDPFNKPQLIIDNSNFSASDKKGEILVKSKWSSIKLDNYFKIPTGPRRYTIKEKNQLRWGIGYDKNSKDGLFISRNSDTIFINKDKTKIDLKKVFFLQRALIGKTEIYSKKNDSVLDKKIEQDAKSLDLFGLEAELKSKFLDLEFYSNVELNSLDFEKFKKIISVDSALSKVLYEDKNSKMEKKTSWSIFGKYRQKIWNSSLGEVEILSSYGTKIDKENFWTHNNINKSSKITLGYGKFQSGKLEDQTQTINRKRLNFNLERNHDYPIWVPKVDEFITNEYEYSPNVIRKGLRFFVQGKLDFYRYDDQNYQNLYTLRAGPEVTLGKFKKSYFDYTKFRVLGKKTIAEGKSPFEFDQIYDKNDIELILEQQIIGPLTFKLSTEFNLDKDSSKYQEFYNKKYEIRWNRRAYNFSAYYSEDQKTGGITFQIHGFNFDGSGKPYK